MKKSEATLVCDDMKYFDVNDNHLEILTKEGKARIVFLDKTK